MLGKEDSVFMLLWPAPSLEEWGEGWFKWERRGVWGVGVFWGGSNHLCLPLTCGEEGVPCDSSRGATGLKRLLVLVGNVGWLGPGVGESDMRGGESGDMALTLSRSIQEGLLSEESAWLSLLGHW